MTTPPTTLEGGDRLSNIFYPACYRISIDLPYTSEGGIEYVPTDTGYLVAAVPSSVTQFYGVCEVFVKTDGARTCEDLKLHCMNMGVLSVEMRPVSGEPVVQDNLASDSYKMHGPYSSENALTVSEGWFTNCLPNGFTEYGEPVSTKWEMDEATECMHITADSYPAYFSLKIAYIGAVGDDKCKTTGLFTGDFAVDPNMFVTQMEPTLARTVYPCFDEPTFKSVMQIAITHKRGYTAVSSGKLLEVHHIGEEGEEGMTTCVFAQTPKLSPYLVAFAVGKFNILETTTSLSPPVVEGTVGSPPPNRTGPVTIRLLIPTDRPAASGMFALDLFKKAIDFFEGLFGYYLPVSKLDMVGVRKMRFLGMENWGLITMLLPYLLVNELTPIERRQRIARLIGHEVAHQWFGNIISISWWRFVWLKEGLARYLEFCFADHCFPKWDMWVEFHSEVLDAALSMDADPSTTHPVVCSGGFDNPRTIFDKFDTISYGKGASVLRMVASLMGDQCLQGALQDLVHTYAFGNFNGEDFGSCLNRHYRAFHGDAVTCDIVELLSYWLEHPSHPLVFVVQDTKLHVTQVQAPHRSLGVIPTLLVDHKQVSLMGAVSSPASTVTNSLRAPTHAYMADSPGGAASTTPTLKALRTRSEVAIPAIIDPRTILTKTAFPTPLHLLLVGSTQEVSCSIITTETATVELPSADEVPTLVNPGAAGVILVDYDTNTWLRLFQCAGRLSSGDIFSITTTLNAHRFLHVGRISTRDPIDRCCIMLAWLKQFCTGADGASSAEAPDVSVTQGGGAVLPLTAVPHAIRTPLRYHGTTWRRISELLAVYQTLLASQNCANDFSTFITFIIAPLAKDGRVGFFPKGTATDYDASDAMSVNTCDNLLQLLAWAKSPLLCNEAPFVVEWVMHSAYDVDLEAVPLSPTCATLMSAVGPCDITNESHAVAVVSAITYMCGCGSVVVWREVMYLLRSLLQTLGEVTWTFPSGEEGVEDELLPQTSTGLYASAFQVRGSVIKAARIWCHHLQSAVVAFDAVPSLAPLAEFIVNSPVMTVGTLDSVVSHPALFNEVLHNHKVSQNAMNAFIKIAAAKSGDARACAFLESYLNTSEKVVSETDWSDTNNYDDSIDRLAHKALTTTSRSAIQSMKCNAGWAVYVSAHFQHYIRSIWADVIGHQPAMAMRQDSVNTMGSSFGSFTAAVHSRLNNEMSPNQMCTSMPSDGQYQLTSPTYPLSPAAMGECPGEVSI